MSADNDTVELTESHIQELEEIRLARRTQKEWKAYEDSRKTSLKTFLAGRIGTIAGKAVVSVQKRKGARTVDYDMLLRDFPDAYAACVRIGDESEALRIHS